MGQSIAGEDPQQLLEENFSLVQHTCFLGHSHRPGLITGNDMQAYLKKWTSLAHR